jgi:Amt family ammonium transporter
MHPVGALVVGGVASAIFILVFTWLQRKPKIDDVLGVWPLHGLCGAWGGIAAGIFGSEALGGMGGVSFMSQLIGTLMGVAIAVIGALVIYGIMSKVVGLRLSQEEEHEGADLAIHKISATAHEVQL